MRRPSPEGATHASPFRAKYSGLDVIIRGLFGDEYVVHVALS